MGRWPMPWTPPPHPSPSSSHHIPSHPGLARYSSSLHPVLPSALGPLLAGWRLACFPGCRSCCSRAAATAACAPSHPLAPAPAPFHPKTAGARSPAVPSSTPHALGTHDGSLTSLSSLKFHLPLSTLGAFFGAQAPDNPHPLYRARPSLPHSLLGMLPLLQMSGPGACRNLHCPAALHIADHAPCFSRQHTVCCDCPFLPLSSLLFPSLNLLHPRRCVALT